jgi:membrane-associated phospholipid phosphatase
MGRVHALSLGVAAGGLLWSAGRARTLTVSPTEEHVFRVFNDAPDELALLVWPIMQMGSLGAVFAAAGGVRRGSGNERAAAVAVVGAAVWGGVKLIKPLVGRGRPAAHVESVHVRGQAQTGLGYPSGHAAVSLTLAMVASHLAMTLRLALAAAAVTSAARMYVGAHLPLDIVGGLCVGWMIGSAVTICVGH